MERNHTTQDVLAGSGQSPSPRTYGIRFTASGSEYFRIWIVNLLLILVTFGMYLPWAKVRKLKYFYGNTQLDGHALDFLGEGRKMFRGTAIVGVFLVAYSAATNFSGWAALLATLIFVGLWPMLFRASMRFRLANTSWRGLRFHFTGDARGAYLAILPPMALALVPFAVLALVIDPEAGPGNASKAASLAMGVTFPLVGLALAAALPWFLWRIRRYQHDNYALGALRTEFRTGPGGFYSILFKTLGIALLGTCAFIALAALSAFGMRGAMGVFAGFVVFIAALFFFNIAPKAYAQVRMQNLVWSRTGSRLFRFRSELAFGPFAALQLKNFCLIFLTLGLYWPFAVVATMRARLEAITLHSKVSLDDLTARQADGAADAAGDAAADLFGLDLGM